MKYNLKKFAQIFICIFTLVLVFSLIGCSINDADSQETKPKTVSITFVQTGFDDKVFVINYGESFTDIPSVNLKKGYTVAWESTDFTQLKNDVVVHAIETPNVYTIYYELGISSATIKNSSTKVTFDAEYSLETPDCDGFVFIGWKVKSTLDEFAITGAYTIDNDLTLVADWQGTSGGYLPPV